MLNPVFLPMAKAPAERAVDPNWKCQRDGACCTDIEEVVMTKEEAALLVHRAPPTITMQFRDAGDNFVAMKAGPCPLYAFEQCLVYEVRPYNCRRFVCLRPHPKTEPFEGGKCMTERVEKSRVAARMATLIQRRAQKWARKHGWGA